MKLDTDQVRHVAAATGIEPVADTTITYDRLKAHFGEDTYFLDSDGAYVWEPVAESEDTSLKVEALQIASWADEKRTQLLKEDPRVKGVQLELGSK